MIVSTRKSSPGVRTVDEARLAEKYYNILLLRSLELYGVEDAENAADPTLTRAAAIRLHAAGLAASNRRSVVIPLDLSHVASYYCMICVTVAKAIAGLGPTTDEMDLILIFVNAGVREGQRTRNGALQM